MRKTQAYQNGTQDSTIVEKRLSAMPVNSGLTQTTSMTATMDEKQEALKNAQRLAKKYGITQIDVIDALMEMDIWSRSSALAEMEAELPGEYSQTDIESEHESDYPSMAHEMVGHNNCLSEIKSLISSKRGETEGKELGK